MGHRMAATVDRKPDRTACSAGRAPGQRSGTASVACPVWVSSSIAPKQRLKRFFPAGTRCIRQQPGQVCLWQHIASCFNHDDGDRQVLTGPQEYRAANATPIARAGSRWMRFGTGCVKGDHEALIPRSNLRRQPRWRQSCTKRHRSPRRRRRPPNPLVCREVPSEFEKLPGPRFCYQDRLP